MQRGNRKKVGRLRLGWLAIAAVVATMAGESVATAQTPNVVGWGYNGNGETSPPASLTDAKAIAAGAFSSLALKSDGTVVAFGNQSGSLPAGLTGVTALAAGYNHGLALKNDGTVVVWGDNSLGQTNLPAALAGVVAISAQSGANHSLALKNNGTVVAWGDNNFGQTTVPPGLINVAAVAAGGSHSLALKADGTVVGWGLNAYGEVTIPGGLTGVVAIAGGGTHSLALKSDGTVVAWGDNTYGQTTVPTALSGVIAISGGLNHSLALKSDGTVVAWGWNQNGQSTVTTGLTGVTAISGGYIDSLALKPVAIPLGWGYNGNGETSPPASLTDDKAVGAGAFSSLALKSNGTVVAFGNQSSSLPAGLTGLIAITAGYDHSAALKNVGTVVIWGDNTLGQTNLPAGLTGVKAISTQSSSNHTLALKSDGTVVAWGYNNFGQTTVPSGLTNVVAVAAGGSHSLALKADGTVVTWGLAAYGLGTIPAGLSGVIAIAGGGTHSLALKSDGTVVAWGDNTNGQTSVPAGLSGVIAISGGLNHSLALKSDGTVVAWGDNSYAQSTVTPGLTGVTAISGGYLDSLTRTVRPPVKVTITSAPTGRTFSLTGVGCQPTASSTTPKTFQWMPGSSCTVSFTSPQNGVTGTRYVFNTWADGGVLDNPRTFSVPAATTTYTANFKTQFLLTTVASPSADGTVSGGGYYDSGSTASVLASPNIGYAFQNWTGSVASSSSAGTTVSMTQARTVTANFITLTPITIQTSPDGLSFTVDSQPYNAAQVLYWKPGETHTIATTTPQPGPTGTQYVWSKWSDNGAISHTVTAPSTAATYTATFTTQYLLTTSVGSGGSAAGTISPATGYFNAGTPVSVTATANTGYSFSGFSGDLSGTTNPASITMNAPHSVTANFIVLTPVTVQTSPAGLSFTVDSQPYSSTQLFYWKPGDTHTIATTSLQSGPTGTQYVWNNWNDTGAISHVLTVPSTATNYTATFTTQYLLTTSVGSGGSAAGTISPATGYFNAGTSVPITATANNNYAFTSFSGDLSGTTSPVSITMNAPHSVTANFVALTPVTVQTSLAGLSFIVDSQAYTAAQVFYWKPGETHTIATTTPQSGSPGTQYLWSNWSDTGAISHVVTVPSTAVTYTATFTTQYYLTTAVGIGGSAGGSISPASGYFNAGTSVPVTATANNGYAFTGFSGDISGVTNPRSISMNAPHSVTANFGLLTAVVVAPASGQYSDPVTLTATLAPAGLAVSGSLQFAVNGVNVGGPVAVSGSGTYPAPASYVITQGQGSYPGLITAVFTSTTVGILGSSGAGNLAVSIENATVTPSASNPLAVPVSAPGGTASSITLTGAIQEVADGSPGDISKATPVTLILNPVVAAPSITCPATTTQVGGQVLTATFTCTNVPVNVYDVSFAIGGNYYTGTADSVLVVYDPSLGFVTGGGTILHNGIPANFGMNVKYLKNGQVQGGMLYIEHRATGDVMVKSNSLTGLAIVGDTAVLVSKATVSGVGNYSIQATAIDNGEPGINDQFGLQVTAPAGTVPGGIVPDLTFAPLNLTGGNIQVPHN